MARAVRSLENLSDILILVVSPVLVMILVGSLAFFTLQCFYDGQFITRLHFATGLFVMAAVLVSRIAIEEGREYASAFALPLGVVAILNLMRFTDIGPWLNIPLILFIWWATDKLTWDCTVLDEQKDASGEGLLQTVGMDDVGSEDLDAQATTDRKKAEETSFWQRWKDRRKRHHTPGVWVIYFGLAAIPVFGLGQSLLPEESRGAGFLLLCTYVASALALLMITSFLQMRRYLMQRRLPFSEKMAATWLGTGGAVIIGLMLLCLLLPRPNTGYSMVETVSDQFEKFTSRDDLKANRNSMGKEGVRSEDQDGSGESEDEATSESEQGKQASEDAEQGKQEGEKGEGGQNKSESGGENKPKDEREQQGDGDEESDRGQKKNEGSRDKQDGAQEDSEGGENESESESGEQQENEDGKDGDDEESNKSDSKPQSLPKPPDPNPLKNLSLPPIPKLIYFLIVGIGVLVVMYFYGRQIMAAIRAFIRDIAEFFRRLFGGKRVEETAEEEEVVTVAPPPRPFRAFKNPFTTGQASRLSPQQLVAYTFEALQAWAYEQQCARKDDQTPLEFAGQVSASNRAVGPHARNLAVLYNQAAYAPQSLGKDAVKHIQALWQALE